MIVLKNCRLIPYLTDGYSNPTADIFIDGKHIQGIYPCGTQSCEDAECYDLNGKTVIPGYFDLHAHLMFTNQNWEYLMHRSESTYVMDSAAYAKTYLKLGYTTIRDAGNDYYASVTVRDNINSGVLTGARVTTSGKILTPTTRGNSSFGTLYKEIDGADAMLKACREECAAGVDFIKYMCTGAMLNLGGVPGQIVTTPEELRAIVAAAEGLGTYVAAHCHGTLGIKEAIKAGVRTIEHASYMDEECVELILKRGNDICTVPTFAVAYSLVSELSGPVVPEFKSKTEDGIAHMAQGIHLCQAAGITIGFGTDLDMENAAKYPGIEFQARASYGVDNETILKQATIESAKILRMDDKLGTICVGKLADLVVVDGAPDEDISCMMKYPAMVWKEGVLFSTILVVILIGWLSGRNTCCTDSSKEFLLTEKGINKLQAGFSMAATDFGGNGLVGAIGYCYFVGISGIWWNLAAAPAFILVGLFLAKKFNRMDCATLPEYFGKRYGKGVKLLSCILHILTNIAALSVQYTVSCTVLHIVTGFNINVSLVISVLIVLFLTSGGLRAVVNTDAVLFIIIVISILLMVPFSIRAAGGYATLKANVPVEFFRFDQLGAWTPISWILLCMLNYSTNQNYIQRMVSAKDTGTAKFGALFTAGFYVIISMALGLIGIAAYVLLPGIEDSNMIFATMLVRFFPHGLLGIGLAAVFAATISTGTSMLHATATLIVNDIYVPLGKSERNDQSILVTSRICVFAVALFALSISMFSSNIVNICYIGGLFYGVSAFVPMVLGLYSKFVTGKAVLISMVMTVVLSLLWEYFPSFRISALAQIPSNVFGLAVSAGTICIISVLTNKVRKDEGHV